LQGFNHEHPKSFADVHCPLSSMLIQNLGFNHRLFLNHPSTDSHHAAAEQGNKFIPLMVPGVTSLLALAQVAKDVGPTASPSVPFE
jgi:hypothetical protein